MGLMYVFPATEEEIDRIDKLSDGSISLKTYGLPLVFWGYLTALLGLIVIMFVAIRNPLGKVLNGDDFTNKLLAYAVLALLFGLPILLFCLYFYEKRISKKANHLKVSHHLFGIAFTKKSYQLQADDAFEITHLLESPNVARMQGQEQMRGFQNKGYFELHLKTAQGEMIFLDRHSRKADLEKIKNLLSQY